MTDDPDTDTRDEPERPSRSARKRDAEALQALGLRLAMLVESDRQRLPLAPELVKALNDYRAITTNGAKRRQIQFIGRLMREADSGAVEAALAGIEQRSATARYRQHELERWRTQLIAEASALTRYMEAFPRTDVRQLRALIRDARAPAGTAVQVRAFRELFRFLRDNSLPDSALPDSISPDQEDSSPA